MKKAPPYTFVDLLENEAFISFVHYPTKESRNYWYALIKNGTISRNDYELAQYYIKQLSESDEHLEDEELKDMWINIRIKNKNHLRKKQQKQYLLSSSLAITASLLIVGFILFRNLTATDRPDTVVENRTNIENVSRPDVTSDDIQVILSDNNRITVKDNNTEIKYNDKGEAEVNSQKIEESIKQTTANQIAYNQVIIPKGKFSSLTLSDGSKLWLNAASRVVYPPVFERKKREIFIEGEAYIEVTPDENRPFIVKTKQMDVRVLGTSFNISAYEEEKTQTIVLVSGSVTVEAKNKETKLSPNQLFSLAGENSQVQNIDVRDYISWKEGYYIFKSETLSHILKRLSNYYGVAIEFDHMVGNMYYSGKMDLKEDIERVLGGLCYTAPIEYQQENDVYYLSFIN